MVVGIGTVTLVAKLVTVVRLCTEQITAKAERLLGEKVHSIVHLLCSKLPQMEQVLYHQVKPSLKEVVHSVIIVAVDQPVQVAEHSEVKFLVLVAVVKQVAEALF